MPASCGSSAIRCRCASSTSPSRMRARAQRRREPAPSAPAYSQRDASRLDQRDRLIEARLRRRALAAAQQIEKPVEGAAPAPAVDRVRERLDGVRLAAEISRQDEVAAVAVQQGARRERFPAVARAEVEPRSAGVAVGDRLVGETRASSRGSGVRARGTRRSGRGASLRAPTCRAAHPGGYTITTGGFLLRSTTVSICAFAAWLSRMRRSAATKVASSACLTCSPGFTDAFLASGMWAPNAFSIARATSSGAIGSGSPTKVRSLLIRSASLGGPDFCGAR